MKPDRQRVTCKRPFGKVMDGYPSGQRGLTVNQLAVAFGGSNPSPSTIVSSKITIVPAALIAQLAERVLGKNEVMGSNPIEGFLPTIMKIMR